MAKKEEGGLIKRVNEINQQWEQANFIKKKKFMMLVIGCTLINNVFQAISRLLLDVAFFFPPPSPAPLAWAKNQSWSLDDKSSTLTCVQVHGQVKGGGGKMHGLRPLLSSCCWERWHLADLLLLICSSLSPSSLMWSLFCPVHHCVCMLIKASWFYVLWWLNFFLPLSLDYLMNKLNLLEMHPLK